MKLLEIAGKILNKTFWFRHNYPRKRVPEWCRHILFSKREGWEENIKADFKAFPQVMLTFGAMSIEAIERADIVVPYEFEDLLWLADRPSLTKKKFIPIPSRGVVELCHNKRLFNSTLSSLGFEEILPDDHNLTPPYILKPNQGESSNGTFVVTSFDSEIRNANLVEDPSNLKQQLVLGMYEYATHMIVRNGKILAELTIEYRFATDKPVKGKTKCVWRRAVRCPDIENLLAVLQSIGFEGICCFNYKMVSGKIQLIELNPRFGGSLSSHFSYLLSQIA